MRQIGRAPGYRVERLERRHQLAGSEELNLQASG